MEIDGWIETDIFLDMEGREDDIDGDQYRGIILEK